MVKEAHTNPPLKRTIMPFDGLYDDESKNNLLTQCWTWVKEKYPELF